MTGERRGVAMVGAILLALVLGMWLIGAPRGDAPLDPRSHHPGGTSGLMAVLRELGATVELDASVPGTADASSDVDVALVLRDRLDDVQHDDLERWVRSGGTVVVTDPGSQLAPDADSLDPFDEGDVDDPASEANDLDEDLVITTTLTPGDCDVDAIDHPAINQLKVYGGPVLYEVGSDDQSCYGGQDQAYVVARPLGEGAIVALGGSGILVNRTLDDQDNAAVIAALLVPRSGARVAVFDPTAPAPGAVDADRSIWELIPTGAYQGMVQLGLAFLVYVAWRARRLGKPVAEPQPVKVAGSELVAAVGGLLERAKSPQHAADVLRADLRRDLSVQLGLASSLRAETLAEVVAERTTLDAARVQAALGPGPVTTDADLMAVAQLIEIVRKEVLDHVGS